MKIGNNKGFTLIELLVTIAIIGVMMGAVIVAINPAKRLADARDADGKTKVNAVATAMEACATLNSVAGYVSCDTSGELAPDYVKIMPTGMTFSPIPCTATKCCVYFTLENGATTPAYWIYQSSTGKAAEYAASTCL